MGTLPHIKAFILYLTIITTTFSLNAATESSHRLFVVTGEQSGEHLGAWHVRHHRATHPEASLTIHAIGGDTLQQAGATIIQSHHELSLGFTSMTGIPSHLWHLWDVDDTIRAHAHTFNSTHITLVYFYLLNFPLARRLKNDFPRAHITYVAPPEMWLW